MVLDAPLSNGQLELMKMFTHELSDKDLVQLKRMLAKFFADRASDEMDRLWETEGWSNTTMKSWLGSEDSGS